MVAYNGRSDGISSGADQPCAKLKYEPGVVDRFGAFACLYLDPSAMPNSAVEAQAIEPSTTNMAFEKISPRILKVTEHGSRDRW